jgi:MFS transporter, ACS family, D-galactonate transporter
VRHLPKTLDVNRPPKNRSPGTLPKIPIEIHLINRSFSLAHNSPSAALPMGWSIPSLIAPRDSVGTLRGILNLANQIKGIAAPIITGYILHTTHSLSWAFVAAAVFRLIGIAGYVVLLGRIEPIPEPG